MVRVVLLEFKICKQYSDDDHGYSDHCTYFYNQAKQKFLETEQGIFALTHGTLKDTVEETPCCYDITMRLIAEFPDIIATEFFLKFD